MAALAVTKRLPATVRRFFIGGLDERARVDQRQGSGRSERYLMPANSFARQLAYGCVCALILLMLVGSAATRVLAGSLLVTTTADDVTTNGLCSLREAIINANNDDSSGSTDCAAGSGSDLITFNVSGSIVLMSSLPAIIGDLTITGPGPAADALTISGNNAVRVLKVNAGARLTLNNLTVSNGLVTNDYGGGIRNSGTLLINNSRFVNNLTAGDTCCSGGGGISSEGVLTVTHSIVSGNSSALGAGINSNGPTALVDTQINGNIASGSGGGVVIFTGGRATIRGGEIFSNTTTSGTAGGGAGIYSADTLTLDGVSIYGNTTAHWGGGILNTGVLTVTRSTLSANSATGTSGSGSALYTMGSLNVANSTISRNFPGIIVYVAQGTLLMTNSTVSSNSGDGIYTGGTSVTLVNDTINQNAGYGIVNSMYAKNTIIANSGSGSNCLFANSGYTQGFNLSNDTSCLLTNTGDQQGIPVLLGPLADNGGPTLTHMPLPGSPAIDKGAGCSALDQRAAPRTGPACDVGSVEYGSFPPLLFLPLIRR